MDQAQHAVETQKRMVKILDASDAIFQRGLGTMPLREDANRSTTKICNSNIITLNNELYHLSRGGKAY